MSQLEELALKIAKEMQGNPEWYVYFAHRLVAELNKTTEPAALAGIKPAEFKRENRYVVLKQKDIAILSTIDKQVLDDICDKIMVIRADRGKKGILAVVVEHDWPEYEYVWGIIKHRVEMK